MKVGVFFPAQAGLVPVQPVIGACPCESGGLKKGPRLREDDEGKDLALLLKVNPCEGLLGSRVSLNEN